MLSGAKGVSRLRTVGVLDEGGDVIVPIMTKCALWDLGHTSLIYLYILKPFVTSTDVQDVADGVGLESVGISLSDEAEIPHSQKGGTALAFH